MARNLRARLSLIRSQKAVDSSGADSADTPEPAPRANADAENRTIRRRARAKAWRGWKEAGYQVLRRTLAVSLERGQLSLPLPGQLPILLPDLGNGGAGPENILFFDLETTGLSGGAGTVAFLAAFGKFTPHKKNQARKLTIDQFLLLDYPGEPDFLDAVLRYMNESAAVSGGFFLTTYNGKCFDSQILKTRCLMNGVAPPVFPQLDLLYPSRRMWKSVLPGCSQAVIETMILGIDRSGDVPGSLAPEIWFDFLRSGRTDAAFKRLLGVCDHNVSDIKGLASIFAAFAGIAGNPLEAMQTFRCDGERLAMIWRRFTGADKSLPLFLSNDDNAARARDRGTAAKLLEAAAERYPRACLRLGFDFLRSGAREKGKDALEKLRAWPVCPEHEGRAACPPQLKAVALRTLAAAEKNFGQRERALAFIEEALALAALPGSLREDLEKRRERLLGT